MNTLKSIICLGFLAAGISLAYGSNPVVYKRAAYFDNNFKDQAFYILVPEGWEFGANIEFSPGPVLAYDVGISQFNKDGTMGLDLIQRGRDYIWGMPESGMLGQMMNADQGKLYNNNSVIHPVLSPGEYFEYYVMPHYNSKYANFRVKEMKRSEELTQQALKQASKDPDLVMLSSSGLARISIDAVTVEFECVQAGKAVDGLWAGIFIYTLNNHGFMNWRNAVACTFFTPKGAMEKNSPLFSMIIKSMYYNPTWLAKIRHTRNTMKNIYSDLNEHIRLANEEIYGKNSNSQDRIFEKYSETIRGTSDYVDPITGTQVNVSNLYENVWVNSNGDVILTDESFNPNTESRYKGSEWRKASK